MNPVEIFVRPNMSARNTLASALLGVDTLFLGVEAIYSSIRVTSQFDLNDRIHKWAEEKNQQ